MTELTNVISAREIARMLGVHKTTVMKWVSLGKLPKPIIMEPRMFLWNVDEINNCELVKSLMEEDARVVVEVSNGF